MKKNKDKKKDRKNPPPKAKIASLPKDKARADAQRTREYNKDLKERKLANLLTQGRAAKTLANIKVEGSGAKQHLAGPNLIPRNKPSAKEALDEAKETALNLKIVKQLIRNEKSAQKVKQYGTTKGSKGSK